MDNGLSNILHNPVSKGTTSTHYKRLQRKQVILEKQGKFALHSADTKAFTKDFRYVYNYKSIHWHILNHFHTTQDLLLDIQKLNWPRKISFLSRDFWFNCSSDLLYQARVFLHSTTCTESHLHQLTCGMCVLGFEEANHTFSVEAPRSKQKGTVFHVLPTDNW